MSFAPSLTWMHLFPSGTAYDCDHGPDWFREALRLVTGGGGVRVRIAFDRDLASLTELGSGVDGLVAVNCSGLRADRLAAAGFGYVRRFAAIPNFASARWFIPLDSPAIASAAFGLYSPTRLSAKFKRAAAKLAARARLPLWYRDEVVVIQRGLPPLERLLQDVLPGHSLRLALSAGAPEPARNRKASAALLGADGKMVGFAKLATSPLARTLVEREAVVLSALGALAPDVPVAPRLIYSGEVDGGYLLVQTPLKGSPVSARMTSAHRQMLGRLEHGPIKPAVATQTVRSMRALVDALGPAAADLRQALDRALPTLSTMHVPSTVIHGDFAPWNLRRHGGAITAFDWEYGQVDGLPMLDEIHHEFQVGYLMHGWSVDQAVAALARQAGAAARFPTAQTTALQVAYLVDVIARLLDEGYSPTDPMLVWHRAVLARTAGTLGEGRVA